MIKIDVEGFEYKVIESLRGIKTNYMLLEVSSNREKGFTTSELYQLLIDIFGPFETIYQGRVGQGVDSFDTLLKFVKPNNSNRK